MYNDNDILDLNSSWDLTDADFEPSEHLAPGTYPFEITAVKNDTCKGTEKIASGTPGVKVTCRVDERATITQTIWLTKNLAFKLLHLFRSTGILKEDEVQVPNPRQALNSLMHKKGFCKISENEYNGKQYNNIIDFMYGKLAVKKVDEPKKQEDPLADFEDAEVIGSSTDTVPF